MIAVFGGSGRLGRGLVERLADAGHSVRVVTRDPERCRPFDDPRVELVRGDVRDRATLPAALAGVETVVSAVTGFGGRAAGGARAVDWLGNANLIGAATDAGVGQFVLLSAAQASPAHPIELFRMKYRAEQALRSSGLAWTILRPTAYAELWLEMLGRPLVETGRTRVLGRGVSRQNFVSVNDVAAVAALAVDDPMLRGTIVELPGPDNLSFDELVAIIRQVTGTRGSVSHVSPAVLRAMALVVRPFNHVLAAQIRTALVLDGCDMSADLASRPWLDAPVTSVAEVAARLFAVRDAGASAAPPAGAPAGSGAARASAAADGGRSRA